MCLDNWYTSVELALKLFDLRTMHILGTIKTNRRSIPKVDGVIPNTGRERPDRGYMHAFKAVINDYWNLYFTGWMDSKPVHILSSFAPQMVNVMRWATAIGERIRIPRPTTIGLYNSCG